MADVVVNWPDELKRNVIRQSFQQKDESTLLRTKMETGPIKQRARYLQAVTTYTVEMWYRREDYAELVDFFRTTMAAGSLRFIYTHPLTLAEEVFRFGDQPRYRFVGNNDFSVTMTWEQMP